MIQPYKSLNNTPHLMKKAFQRHWVLYSVVFILIFTFIIIKIFFTPPLLNDTHFSKVYYDRNGKLLRMILSADEKYRIYTPLSEISPYVQQATILYEDKYFKYHFGINPISLIKATKSYLSGTPTLLAHQR